MHTTNEHGFFHTRELQRMKLAEDLDVPYEENKDILEKTLTLIEAAQVTINADFIFTKSPRTTFEVTAYATLNGTAKMIYSLPEGKLSFWQKFNICKQVFKALK